MPRRRTIIFMAVLAVLIVGWFARNSWNGVFFGSSNSSNSPGNAPRGALPTLQDDTGGSHPGLSYNAAVRLYVGRGMQFGTDCGATPDSLFIQSSSTVMFGNLAPFGRYIALDGVRYYLRPRDFRILVLSAANTPHTVSVNCGGKVTGHITLN